VIFPHREKSSLKCVSHYQENLNHAYVDLNTSIGYLSLTVNIFLLNNFLKSGSMHLNIIAKKLFI